MKKFCAILASALVISSLAGCGGIQVKPKAGVFMPDSHTARWESDSDDLKAQLESKGYEVTALNAEGDGAEQIKQFEAFAADGGEIAIVASVDGTAFGEALEKSSYSKTIIAYDRQIKNSSKVSGYVTFDSTECGSEIGKFVESALKLTGDGKAEIEIFGGSPTDTNAQDIYNGCMNILSPYLEVDKLVVPSGKIAFEDVCVEDWSGKIAKERMAELLSTVYADSPSHIPSAIVCPNDSIALAVIEACKEAGKTALPIITGQDGSLGSVKSIAAGEQSMTMFKNTRLLAQKAVETAITPIIAATRVNNGKIDVPTFFVDSKLITKDNYKEVLIDSGIYKAEDLK